RLLSATSPACSATWKLETGRSSRGSGASADMDYGVWTAMMRNTVYFGGNGTAQALIILLAYLLVFAPILDILVSSRRPATKVPDVTPETEAANVAVSVPAGAAV